MLSVAHPWVSASSYLSSQSPFLAATFMPPYLKKERKKTDNPREGWENGTPPPHRDFKERSVMR